MLSQTRGRWLPAFGTALPLIILFITVLSIPLAAAQALNLSPAQTASWILVLYGLPGLLGLALAIRYRQPLLVTGNVFALIFVASLGDQLNFPELLGAYIVAGASLVLIGALGLTGWLAAWLPAPIVLGLLAGAIMPFVSGIFTALGQAPLVVGSAFLVYLLGRRLLETPLHAILPALIVGLLIAALTGQQGEVPRLMLPPTLVTQPAFSLRAIATATPVLLILLTVQSNLPSMVFLQSQGYQPPERVVNVVTGVGTIVGSLLGPTAVSISLPATALIAGPQAGERPVRLQATYIASVASVLVALLAGVAAAVTAIIPSPLLLALAGLAAVGVLANALQEITRGPLLLGPLFAFAIALSDISLLGFGPFFWALVIGIAISLLLERDELRALRAGAAG